MFRKIFIMSIATAVFSAVACFVYNKVYIFALGPDFSKVVNIGSLVGFNIAGCMLAGLGYWLAKKAFGRNAEMIFNVVFMLFSFGSIVAPLAISLPLDVQNPELFPGLAVPMHFFPLAGWFTLKPFFLKED
jgi:hypothetical protein